MQFVTRDGPRLHGWFVPAPRGTVILCHGDSGTPAPDLQYVPGFRERGYNVLLLDSRAHGQSEGRFTSLQYLERRDLAAAVRYLEGRGIGRVGLLGFSMGAAASMSGAGDLPQVVAIVGWGTFQPYPGARAAVHGRGRRARGDPSTSWSAHGCRPAPARDMHAAQGSKAG